MLHRPTRTMRPVIALLTLGLLGLPSAAAAADHPVVVTGASVDVTAADGPSGPCPDEDGVTVVVDLTDLDGEVQVGCAPGAPASGTDALTQAGFTEARAANGTICAIDGSPDPCPAEFTGSYWAYWSAEPGGEWVSYTEGSDTSSPAPGAVEGWRYNDGSQPPGIDPPTPDASTGTENETEPAASPQAQEEPQEEAESVPAPLVLGVAVVGLLAVVAVVLSRRRSGLSRGDGPPGQD